MANEHEKVHVICENLCLEEGMTKEQIETKFATKQAVESLASGSPKGVYATVSDLTSANPDTGVYIVTGNGHIYSWTKNGSTATDLGVYQATGIDNFSIDFFKTKFIELGKNKILPISSTSVGITTLYNDETGETSINGTKTTPGGERFKIGYIKVNKTGLYNFVKTIVSGSSFPLYIVNEGNVVHTISSSSLNVNNLNFEKNKVYTIEGWATVGTELNAVHKYMLYDGSIYNNTFLPTEYILKNKEEIKPTVTTPNTVMITSNGMEKEYDAIIDTINHTCTFEDETFYFIHKDEDAKKLKLKTINNLNNSSIDLYDYDADSNPLPGVTILYYDNVANEIKVSNHTKFNNSFDENIIVLMTYFIYKSRPKKIQNINSNFRIKIIPEESKLQGKKLSILGVSVDTYDGYIPEGNATYYRSTNLADVNMTWWKKLLNKTNMELLVNNSWSGARATTTKTTDAIVSSGIHRSLLLNDGQNTPDFIIIGSFILNDWIASSDLGNYEIGMNLPGIDVDLTDNDTFENWKQVTNKYETAMATIFYRLQTKYPNAKIMVMDAYNYYRNGTPLTYAGNTSISKYNEALYKIAKIFGVEIIKISECGITAINSRSYCVEGLESSVAIHPNDIGHTMMAREILEHFKKYM